MRLALIMMAKRDFTLEAYSDLCTVLHKTGYASLSISDYLGASPDHLPQKFFLLRHDVDSQPRHAFKLALIEQQYGLKATYYFRTIPSVFEPATMKQLVSMGHEVGYHYETLGQVHGNIPDAIELFRQELARMREIVPVTSASMHGSPLKRWNNRDIWQQVSPVDFDLLGEAYRDIDYERVTYLNDSGRTWHPTRYNLRDHTNVIQHYDIDSTWDLINLLEGNALPQVCISAHPERWQDDWLSWSMQTMRDVGINWTKSAIKRVRG